MKQKVLITGSAGFVGTHIVEHLIKNTNWDIIGLDSFKHRGDSLRVFSDPSRYKVYYHDLNSPISYRLRKKIGYINYILNIASDSHVERSIKDPVPFVQNNVNVALHMLEFARVVKPEKFIQMSTDEVYGPALQEVRHKEWATILPSNPYSASKAAQEAIAISYWRTYGVPVMITNTMNLIGERQDPEKFVPMLIAVINQGNEVEIHGNENYIGKRFYLHARNQADALLFLCRHMEPVTYLDSPVNIYKPARFHIVGEVELDNLELARMVAKILGKKLKYRLVDFHAVRTGHDRRYALDGSKIEQLGWTAPISFEKSLEKIISWTLEHPEWLI